MRKQITIFIFIVALTLLPVLVVQAQTIELTGSADCEGWNSASTMTFPAGVYNTELDFSVVLTDQAGAEVTRYDWSGQVYREEDPVMTLIHGYLWGLTLDSVYNVNFAFHFMGEEAVLNLELVCGEEGNEPEPGEEPCPQPPGFWKNNSDLWPVETLTLGGIEMDKGQLISIMRRPVRGNGSLLMARELIAAKLNVANGCDDSINSVIEDADSFLIMHPLAENAWRNRVPASRDLRHALSAYNKAECTEMGLVDLGMFNELKVRSATAEQTSFSSLKAMYR